jgi:GntR family transcriptional regulator
MNTSFNPDAGEPGYLYMKLADHLAARIADGSLRPGAMLPNERSLASKCEVSVGTVRRATRLLRNRGLVITLPGRGTYVAMKSPPGSQRS